MTIGVDVGGEDRSLVQVFECADDGEFKVVEEFDDFTPSAEDLRNHWNGPGHLEFYVSANRPDVFEFDVEDYSGCAGGAHETVGWDYLIEDMLGIDRAELREGWTYTVENLTVVWSRGDGWEIDDDVDYYHDGLTASREWKRWLRQKVVNAWWFNIGWRIAVWSGSRKA
jgi:hypothetical protein